MRRSLAVLLASCAIIASSFAQNSSQTNADRKVVSRAEPVYPELAKRMHIHGVVKIEALVRSSGVVKSTRVLGGNPVLVDAARDAVNRWKFEPTQAETTEVVQVTFEQR